MVTLRIAVETTDSAEELDRCTRDLRAELLDTDVSTVEFEKDGDGAPLGSKGLDPESLSALLVTLSASGGVFASVLGVVQAWFQRQRRVDRVSVELNGDKLELEGELTEAQHRLLVDFLRRHESEVPPA